MAGGSGRTEGAGRQGRAAADTAGPSVLGAYRRLVAELLGTFALVLVAAGGEVIAAVSGGEVSPASRAVAPGLAVMVLIYAIGNVSGAHLNPAVTFAFALRRVFPWRYVAGYWLAQVTGAVLAAGVLRALFGRAGHLGITQPHHGVAAALAMEVLLTWLLLTVILGTATQHRLVGADAALAVGAAVALDGLFAAPVSGASMNPARSLGPALVGTEMGDLWVYVAAPFAGAVLAVGGTWLLHGQVKRSETKAAEGEGEQQARAHDSGL